MAVHTYKALPHQWQVLNSRRPMIFLGGGVGTGKTDVGAMWILHQVQRMPPGVLGLICANSYGQLIDSTLRKVYRNLQAAGLKLEPAQLPGSHRPFTLRIRVGNHWAEILCRSLESVELLAGIEVGWWWADETWQSSRAAIDLLMARLRDPRAPHHQALMTTTLDEPGGWMHEMVVSRHDPEWMEVIYASTYDNAHNLPAHYIESLKKSYHPRLFERMVLAKWVSLAEGAIYHGFDRRRHVDDSLEFDPHLPIIWSHDFNIGSGKPMSSVICQQRRVRGGPRGGVRPELHVLDEIVLETADTTAAIAEFRARQYGFPDDRVWIFGDASGRARDTRSGHTDYTLLRAAGFHRQQVAGCNPPVRNRHNAVNSLLGSADGDCRLRLHPRCRTLAKGLETVRLHPGSGYQEEESYEQHVTTALGYLVCELFPPVTASSLPAFWK